MTTPHTRADPLVAAAVFLASIAYLFSFDPFDRPLTLDAATWDYMSVRLLDGLLPYRDVFLHKTPGAIFFGAAGAAVARLVGAPPVLGAHSMMLVLGALGPALLYLLCSTTMPRVVAVAAAIALVAFEPWTVAALEGVRPKVVTVAIGLAALLAARRGRWRTTGVLGAASVLCWQPGVVFLLGAGVDALRAPRDRRAAAMADLFVGACIPAFALLVWLASTSAVEQFFAEAVRFNLHYIDIQAKTPARTAVKMLRELMRWNRAEGMLIPIALVGITAPWARMPASLAVAGLGYVALAFVSFQAWPDTILFGPPLAALLAAGLFGALCRGVRQSIAAALTIAVTLAIAATPSSARFHPPITFARQGALMGALAADVAEDADVIAISLPEFLVHSGRTSRWPWPYLWFGVDRFAAERTAGGFDGMLADLERRPPQLILLARRWNGELRRRFEQWALPRYEKRLVRIYPHVAKPIAVYRLRTRPSIAE